MAAAFKVKYRYRGGTCPDCPDAVVVFDTPDAYLECVADAAVQIKEALVKSRGGAWDARDVIVSEIEYIGPWFKGLPATPPGA